MTESTYRVTPATAQKFGGKAIALTPAFELGQQVEFWPDARQAAPKSCVLSRSDPSFKTQLKALVNDTGYDWRYPLLVGALGSASGTSPLGRLPSYSMIIEASQGSIYGRYLCPGCKINTLAMSAEKAGAEVLFDAEVHASNVVKCTGTPPLTVAGLQSLTLGAQDAAPSTYVLQWRHPWTLTPEGESAITLNPNNWKMTVKNNLTRGGENVVGADGLQHAISRVHENRQDIQVEMELFLEDLVHVDYQLANKMITSLSTVIGGNTLSFNDGSYVIGGSSWPELKQDQMTQKLTWRFASVVVT